MIFTEQKTAGKRYHYKVEDVFGVIEIKSRVKLDKDILDGMVVLLLRDGSKGSTITGTVTTVKGVVTYRFEKRQVWESAGDDDDKNEVVFSNVIKKTPCKNIRTSKKQPAKEYTVLPRWTIAVYNWCKRFAVAFHTAWKSTTKV